jgi:hypothetical protein
VRTRGGSADISVASKQYVYNPVPVTSRNYARWAEAAISTYWLVLEQCMGLEGMPTPLGNGYVAYGRGAYGVVFPTQLEDVVLKITSDPSEIKFLAAASSLRGQTQPTGIVRYYKTVYLPSARRNRPIAAVWREAALRTGHLLTPSDELRSNSKTAIDADYLRREEKSFRRYLQWWNLAGNKIRQAERRDRAKFREVSAMVAGQHGYDDSIFVRTPEGYWRLSPSVSRWRYDYRLGTLLDTMETIAELLENNYGSDAVGGAMSTYFKQGIVLCDLHEENIGQVVRDDDYLTVITDPGHAVFLDDRYDAILEVVGRTPLECSELVNA